jgi:hypothetical protein
MLQGQIISQGNFAVECRQKRQVDPTYKSAIQLLGPENLLGIQKCPEVRYQFSKDLSQSMHNGLHRRDGR